MADETPPEGMEEFVSSPKVDVAANVQGTTEPAPPPGMEDFVRPEMNEIKYGGIGSQILTGAESAADALTFTGAGRLEGYLADKFNAPDFSKESQSARKETNPVSSFLGSATGFGTMMALTGGFGGAGAAAGEGLGYGAEAAASAAAKTAAQAGAEAKITGKALASLVNSAKGAALAEFTTGGRIGAQAIKAGVETAIYSSGNEAAKMVFGDPNQTIGTAAANIGLSGLLGFGLGGAIGGASELWNSAFGKSVASNIDGINETVNKGGEPPPPPTSPPSAGETLPNNESIPEVNTATPNQSSLIKEFNPNAAQVLQSSDRLGIKPVEGMLDKESVTGHFQTELAKQNTIAGRLMNKRLEGISEKLAEHSKDVLSDASEITEPAAGKQLREGVVQTLKNELKPINAGYDAEKKYMVDMVLTDGAKSEAVSPILSHPFVAEFPDSSIAKQAVKIADDIGKLNNVNSVKIYRTMLNGELDKAITAGDSNLIDVLKTAKTSLNGLRDRGINESTVAIAGREGNQMAADTIARIRQLDADYAAHKLKVSETGNALGLGNTGSVSKLMTKLEKLNLKDESLPAKIFDPDNLEKLKFFQEKYREQFEIARQSKIRDIYEKSIDTAQGSREKFSTQKFLSQISDKKMNPEAREMLFPGMGEKINDIRTIQANFPGSFNTSNTAAALGFFNKIGENAIDFGKLAISEAIPFVRNLVKDADEPTQIATAKILASGDMPTSPTGFKSMVDYIAKAVRGESIINKSVKNIFEGTAIPLTNKILSSDKDREKLDKKLMALQDNPSPLFNMHGDLGHYLPDHAMVAAQTTSNAVNYLNSIRPGTKSPNPLDKKIEPTQAEKVAFNQALDIANQPLLVLEKLKKGTILPSDIMHVKSMYPALYDKLNKKLTHGLIDSVHEEKNIPYHTKMGLSLFLGQPLDSTMTPSGIMAAQPKPEPMPQQPQPTSQQGHHSSMRNIGKLATADQTPQQARIQARQNK